jgi:hypothetical protein
MKISWLNEVLKDAKEDEDIVCILFTKSEAEEHVINNIMESFPDYDFQFSKEDWEWIVEKMHNDDGLWQSAYESFEYYINRKMQANQEGVKES